MYFKYVFQLLVFQLLHNTEQYTLHGTSSRMRTGACEGLGGLVSDE